MRAGASILLVLVALAVSGCGKAHRAETSQTATSQPSVFRTIPSEPKYVNLALISARTGIARHGVPNYVVCGAVADGRGGWFVSANVGLERMRPDGKLDLLGWGSRQARSLAGRCGRLIKSGSRLYVDAAERVESANPTERVEAFDAKTGALLWRSPPITAKRRSLSEGDVYPIRALAASSTRVYVGGEFTRVGDVPRQALVALDARTGRLLDWRPPPIHVGADPMLKPSVKALALAGSRLYVGGLFYSIGGESRSSLAALDADTGALLAWKPVSGHGVDIYDVGIILVTHGQVIAVGDRSTLNSFSVRTARPFAWPRRKNMACALAVDGPLVYLGGDIQRPVSALSNNMVRFNIKTILKSNFENFAESLANYVNVDLIVPSGGQVLVGGSFTDSIG